MPLETDLCLQSRHNPAPFPSGWKQVWDCLTFSHCRQCPVSLPPKGAGVFLTPLHRFLVCPKPCLSAHLSPRWTSVAHYTIRKILAGFVPLYCLLARTSERPWPVDWAVGAGEREGAGTAVVTACRESASSAHLAEQHPQTTGQACHDNPFVQLHLFHLLRLLLRLAPYFAIAGPDSPTGHFHLVLVSGEKPSPSCPYATRPMKSMWSCPHGKGGEKGLACHGSALGAGGLLIRKAGSWLSPPGLWPVFVPWHTLFWPPI